MRTILLLGAAYLQFGWPYLLLRRLAPHRSARARLAPVVYAALASAGCALMLYHGALLPLEARYGSGAMLAWGYGLLAGCILPAVVTLWGYRVMARLYRR